MLCLDEAHIRPCSEQISQIATRGTLNESTRPTVPFGKLCVGPHPARLNFFSLEIAHWSVPEIFEVCGDAEIATAHELNDSLQFIFLFPRDANLPVL